MYDPQCNGDHNNVAYIMTTILHQICDFKVIYPFSSTRSINSIKHEHQDDLLHLVY